MKEHEIIEKLVNALRSDEYEAIAALDNSEERGSNMVSVAMDNTEQVNPFLPDYRYTISIYVSTHITEDDTGTEFEKIVEDVKRRLDKFVLKEAPLDELFEEIPVVYFAYEDDNRMTVDDTYGKCYLAHLTYTAITSF